MTKWFKTKMITKPMLSVVVLGVVATCSITSAQSSGINGYTTSTETQTTQATSEKGLSDFGSRLASRMGEVFQEVVGLVTNGLKQSGSQENNSGSTSSGDVQTVDSSTSSSEVVTPTVQSSFTDVETIPEKYFVDTLASHGIIKGTNGKFSPDNYTRLGDFIKILVDTYRTKVGYDLDSNAGLTNKTYFMGGVLPVSLEKSVNTAYELGFLDNVLTAKTATKSDLDSFLTTNIIDQMLTNIGNEFPGMVTKPKMGLSDLFVKRGVMTKYVVQGFDLAPLGNDAFTSTQKSYFSDITGNPYGTAIKTLADLGIVNSQLKKFYPDNYLRNYEFTVMLVNAQLVSQNKKFDPASYQGSTTKFVDVDTKASYTPWIKYAQDHNLISYLTVTQAGKNFFNPNQAMTKLQVYHILEEVTGIQKDYDTANAGQKMTRGEFASILVQAFDLKVPTTSDSNTENQAQNTVEESGSSTIDNVSLLMQIKALLAKI